MICPRCKTEYREGFLICADCGVELKPDPPGGIPEKRRREALTCPVCGTEYQEGYTICADCGVLLGAGDLATEREQAPDAADFAGRTSDYLPVHTVTNGFVYDIIRAHLDAAEISYFPPPELVARLGFPFVLRVKADQAEDAYGLLQDLTLDEPPPADQEDAEAEEQALASAKTNAATGTQTAAAAMEALIVREGRYLAVTTDAGAGLPGGFVPVDGAASTGVLEAELARTLDELYGISVEEDLYYLGNRLCRDSSGRAALRVVFLARRRQGETQTPGAQWLYADELAELPGLQPGLAELVRWGDEVRVAKGW